VIFTSESPDALVRKKLRRRRKGQAHLAHSVAGNWATEFLQGRLVDELHLGVVPVACSARVEGFPLFPGGLSPRRELCAVHEIKTLLEGVGGD